MKRKKSALGGVYGLSSEAHSFARCQLGTPPGVVSKCQSEAYSLTLPSAQQLWERGRDRSHPWRSRQRGLCVSAAGEHAALRCLRFSTGGSLHLISGSELAEFPDEENPSHSLKELEEIRRT